MTFRPSHTPCTTAGGFGPIDGTAVAVAVKRYERGEITVDNFLDELRRLSVNKNVAARFAETFAPAAAGQ